MTVECSRDVIESIQVLALSDAELQRVDADLEHLERLRIGSRSEILVLSALTKRYEAIDTEGSLAIFDLIDVDRNGIVTRSELRRGVEKAAVRDFVAKTRNVTLKGLFKRKKCFDRAFDEIGGNDGVITKADFVKFVKSVAVERLRYMRVVGLLKQRCFWGRGLDTNDDNDDDGDDGGVGEEHGAPPRRRRRRRTALGPPFFAAAPRGFWEDWRFYVENNHPYLALFLRDEAHPFSRRDAFGAEIVKQSYCLVASYYADPFERDWLTLRGALFNWVLSMVVVAVPLMVLEEFLFYLLACPCLRFERRGRKRERCFACLERLGDLCGRLVIFLPLALGALFLLGYAIYLFSATPRRHSNFALVWIIGLLSEYLVTWPLLHFVVHFNFWLPDCDRMPCYHGLCYGCCGLWHWLNCGRWATERRLALSVALQGDDDLLDDAFYNL